jgi:hypothetical protein
MTLLIDNNPYRTLAPGSTRALGIEWDELMPAGVSVTALSVTCTPSGLTLGTPVVSSPIGYCTFQAPTGATIGQQYVADLAATWSDGQVDVRTIYITIAKKS